MRNKCTMNHEWKTISGSGKNILPGLLCKHFQNKRSASSSKTNIDDKAAGLYVSIRPKDMYY